ncbi:MAG TPA: BrnT family toxin [Candidatus Limnocylindria bacterium]|nr:BrnT family toxin [Candidatus Limnocylindria bacterium]
MHKCAYNSAVSCEWDPAKARANLSKHGVDFADAATALEDDRALTIRDPPSSQWEGAPSAVCWWWSTRGAKKLPG